MTVTYTYNPRYKRSTKKSKYGNRKVVVDNIKFDSKWESERYLYLKSLEKAGTVKNLKLQVRFYLKVNGYKICAYVADFTYEIENINGEWNSVVEDAKGVETPEFKLKKKLMKAIHNIEIYLSKK
tara:strand:+ start:7174 stop:7548 length:375 start_codon:yes stop_codon:yes gene_type:complete